MRESCGLFVAAPFAGVGSAFCFAAKGKRPLLALCAWNTGLFEKHEQLLIQEEEQARYPHALK